MTLTLSIIDQILVVVYLIIVLGVGIIAAHKSSRDEVNYLLMGRRLTLLPFIASLVSTWYGGILGVGEFTYRYGILNWVTQGLPYYIFAILFALFLAPKVRETNLFTIPDMLYEKFGKPTGIIGTVLVFILTNPAPHLLMVSLLLSTIFNIGFWWGYLFALFFTLTYVFFGGLKSDVYTDIVQLFMMYFGFGVLLFLLVRNFGGVEFLNRKLPASHLNPTGNANWQFIALWFFIALWTFVDPGFYQKCYAAKSPKTAKTGILISVGMWFLFDLLTTTSGLYARALLPDIDPVNAYPLLAQKYLPPIWRGIFFISLLATVMSTLDSNSLIAATTIGRDLLWRLNPQSSNVKNTRWGLLVTIIVATLIIKFTPSVVKIWYLLGTFCIPALLIPVLSALKNYRLTPKGAFLCMISALTFTLTWYLIGTISSSWKEPKFPFDIQPFFIGVVSSFLSYTLIQIKKLS